MSLFQVSKIETIERLPGSETILYFGGFINGSDQRDDKIKMFDGVNLKWDECPVRLPSKLVNNTAVMTLLNPDIC